MGIESSCEFLDFQLDGEPVPNAEILIRLNAALVEGVRVLSVYDDGQKIKNIAYLDCTLWLEYDRGVPSEAMEAIRALFAQETVNVSKKSKNGMTEQNIIPMIRSLQAQQTDACTLTLRARVCCQNPSLNPMQLCAAIEHYLPGFAPDFVRCTREEVLDLQENIFR